MATDLSAFQQQMTDLLGKVQLQPKQNMAAPAAPAKPRFPYMDTRINFDIRDAAEEKIVADILSLDYEGLTKVNEELQLALNLNYPYLNEHWHSVKVRVTYYRMSELRGQGKLKPSMTLGDFAGGWIKGWLLADEFWKRHGR